MALGIPVGTMAITGMIELLCKRADGGSRQTIAASVATSNDGLYTAALGQVLCVPHRLVAPQLDEAPIQLLMSEAVVVGVS